MIDLSITQDPIWIKEREQLWKPIGKMLSEDLRKNDLEKVHNYFMMGTLRTGETLSDGAKFSWFPIQSEEGWNYLFQYSIKDSREFKNRFEFTFEDQSHRALSPEQELAMWDYFAGNEFNPRVTSKVPVGEKQEIVSFDVDRKPIASKFSLFFKDWAGGSYVSDEPKHIVRINYYFSLLKTLSDDLFIEKDSDGDPASKLGFAVANAFKRVCRPEYASQAPLSKDAIAIRKHTFAELRNKLDALPMPPEMKAVWESEKSKGIIE